jgi:uncharacterized membrane protein
MNRIEFFKELKRLMFWKYRRSEINDILGDFSEYIDIAVSRGEDEKDVINRLGSPKSILNEPDIHIDSRLGNIRKSSAIALLLYFLISILAGINHPGIISSITFCVLFPLLLSFVLSGEFNPLSPASLPKRYNYIFSIFPMFTLICWVLSYFLLVYALQPGITQFKNFMIFNFSDIFTFLLDLQIIFGLVILTSLVWLYIKNQFNIFYLLTIWSGVINSIMLLKQYFRDLSNPGTVMYHMLLCLTPFFISLVVMLSVKLLQKSPIGKEGRIWMLK